MIADHLEDRGLRVFRAPDVEQSLDPFVEGQGVLVLANRYDGLDLPGDACRLLVFEDMPIGTSRLEQFLVYRVGASDLMRDRIRTRFAQGIGRCTRNSNDYACVIARGQRLIDFCLRTEVRESLSPELQAEMRFGIQNSREIDEQGLTDLIELFFEQDEDWQQAVRAIESLKESTSQREDLVSERLQEVVEWEVDFVYALWAQDCETAVTKAVQVADRLGGQETAAYRAWWYYQAGSASWLYGLHDNDDQRINQARAFFRRATEARFTTWLAPLTRADAQLEASRETPVQDIHAAEGAIEFIDGLGYSGPRFERFTDRMQEFLEQSSSDAFEAGLKRLGQLLGMRAIRPDDVADPDAVWICHAKNVFVLEAKSEEEPRHAVSVATVRQARTHPDWVRANCEIPDDVEFLNVVISPRTTIEPEAARSSEGLYHATLDDIREVASQAVSALSVIRANAASVQRDAAVTTAMEHLHAFRLTPTQLWSRLKERPLDSLPKPGD